MCYVLKYAKYVYQIIFVLKTLTSELNEDLILKICSKVFSFVHCKKLLNNNWNFSTKTMYGLHEY